LALGRWRARPDRLPGGTTGAFECIEAGLGQSVFERKPAPDLIRGDTGSREENALKQESSVLIQSEPKKF
jgi:hypothetical protein